jgi:septum site-determining protein MinC
LRAGQAVSHNGDLIIIGDVNAGAEVLAQGDITIWGSLRGIAHAGVDGNTKAEIRALRLQPIQIRIANFIARSPDGPAIPGSLGQGAQYSAETAKLVNGKIRIVRSSFDG